MLLRYCVFAFILAKSCCFGTRWQLLEDFKQTIRKYARTGDEIIKSMDDFLVKRKYSSLDFLYNIDHIPYLERGDLRPYCTNVYQRLDGLLYSYKSEIAVLETPLISMRLEIKDRISDLNSTIDVYYRIAENKHGQCQPGDYACEEQIFYWLEDKVHQLQCRVKACRVEKSHTVVARSVSSCEEFTCENGECIPHGSVCNNNTDCEDGSDESPDCSRFCFDGFHCRDLRCIGKEQICDGNRDCDDGADEQRCKTTEMLYSKDEAATCSLDGGNFQCANKACVPLLKVCDSNDDCGDGSDEGEGCKDKNCSAGCTASGGVCLPGPKGALCLNDCPHGSADDGGTCRPGPMRSPDSLAALFEQVPYLFQRYVGAEAMHKKRLISNLESAFSACEGPPQGQLSSRIPTLKKIFQTSQ